MKTGIQSFQDLLDSRVRGNDEVGGLFFMNDEVGMLFHGNDEISGLFIEIFQYVL